MLARWLEGENVILNNGYHSQQFPVSAIFILPSLYNFCLLKKDHNSEHWSPYQFIVTRPDDVLLITFGECYVVYRREDWSIETLCWSEYISIDNLL